MTLTATKVIATSPDGVTVTYNSMQKAARALGVDYKRLRITKLRGGKTINGYEVKFA